MKDRRVFDEEPHIDAELDAFRDEHDVAVFEPEFTVSKALAWLAGLEMSIILGGRDDASRTLLRRLLHFVVAMGLGLMLGRVSVMSTKQ